jgi:hypothetical protein
MIYAVTNTAQEYVVNAAQHLLHPRQNGFQDPSNLIGSGYDLTTTLTLS